jgi:menaquinone-dependent protoporphyrinogen oxidase
MPPRMLVIFGTTEGQTAKIAGAMAATLRRAGISVDLAEAGPAWDPDPADYAAVIVAASVHAGGYQRPLRRWVRSHAAALRGRPTAFVSVCLAILKPTPEVIRDLSAIMGRFFDATGWTPSETKSVAGALPYTKYGWFKRRVMRRIVAKAKGDIDITRDYEYTDWDDLQAFTQHFADANVLQTREAQVLVSA